MDDDDRSNVHDAGRVHREGPGRVADNLFGSLSSDVNVVWLHDPERKTVTIFRPNQPQKKLLEADTIDGEPELPGFEAAVKGFFLVPTRLEPDTGGW